MTRPISGQTVAFQYTVTGSFDGTTRVPDAPIASSAINSSQFYNVETENLGLIVVDPPVQAIESTGVNESPQGEEIGGARGNRWISWLEITLDSAAPAGSYVELVSIADDGTVTLLKTLGEYSGETKLYLDQGFRIPQGGAIRVRGGGPGVVRLHTIFMEGVDSDLLASLVLAQMVSPGAISATKIIEAATAQAYYQDNPGADGNGTYAESFFVESLGLAAALKLTRLAVRVDLPAGASETATIRLFRYRKLGPNGAFSYTQVTDTYVVNSSTPWSWTERLEDHIRDFTFNPVTDSIAVSNVYSSGGTPAMRALRVDFAFGAAEPENAAAAEAAVLGDPDGPTWPPTP